MKRPGDKKYRTSPQKKNRYLIDRYIHHERCLTEGVLICAGYPKNKLKYFVIISHLRKWNPTAFRSSRKKTKTSLSVINARLWTLECKPINCGVTSEAPTNLHDTGLKAVSCHIFHPNKSSIMGSWWFVSMINGSKYSHGSSTEKTAAEWHRFTVKTVSIHLFNIEFSSLNTWKEI